jgi:Family of unknown function (DUF6504)
MRSIRGEPVEVWLSDGRPARFVWRGRLYTVLFVRDRRSVTATPAATPPMAPGETGQLAGQEFWLVDATAQRAVAASTYELCHDLGADRWTLSRS